jgi:tetratricopeptide (TPR) repeat protein
LTKPYIPFTLGRMARTLVVLGMVLLSSLSFAAPVDDPDTEVAKRLFKQGTTLYMDGKYEEALAAFERARLAKPLPAFDFNIAKCNDRLGRWPEALAAYERFAATTKDAEELADANARIPVLRERVRTTVNRTVAEEHYKKAVIHFNNDAYLPAAEEFKLAFHEVPDPLYLYSIGSAYRLASDPANAIKFFEQFMKAAPADAPQRAVVEKRLKELKASASMVSRPKTPATSGTASERLKPIVELIKKNRDSFRACFDRWSATHPRIGGQVTLSFLFDPEGVPDQLLATTKGFDAPDVTACMIKFARTLTYPAAPNAKYTKLNYPFDFKPTN